MFDQLRELVQRYVNGEISYRSFREQFAVLFVAASDSGNVNLDLTFNSVESRCAAFDHDFILESQLKFKLAQSFQSSSQNVGSTVSVVFDFFQ